MKKHQPFTRRFNQSFCAVTLTLWLIAAATDIFGAPGDLDPSWGNGGIVVTPFGDAGQNIPTRLHAQPDGKIIVSGFVFAGSAYEKSFIARYNPNGTLDAAFGTGGVTFVSFDSGELYTASAPQPDGKIVVAGWKQVGGDRDFAVARYNADGTPDATFGANGKISLPVGNNIDEAIGAALQPDGKIVVAGRSLVSGSGYDFSVGRLQPNGALDPTFGTGGKTFTAVTLGDDSVGDDTLVVQPDGKILVGGYGGVSQPDFALVRYNSDDTLDPSFGANGKLWRERQSHHRAFCQWRQFVESRFAN